MLVMENGFLDKVEDNAAVRIWSEKTQLEKGDSLTEGYTSKLLDFTRISVTQNELQELRDIWDCWDEATKQLFYLNYGDLPYLLDIRVDKHLFRAMTQYWNLAYSCFTFGEVDLVPTVEEYTALLRSQRARVDKIYFRAANAPTFVKKLMSITGMSEQWVMARIQQKGEGKCIPWVSLRDLMVAHPDVKRKVDIFALSIYSLVIFPKALRHVYEAVIDLFDRLDKGVTPCPEEMTYRKKTGLRCYRTSRKRMLNRELLGLFPTKFSTGVEVMIGVAMGPIATLEYNTWRSRRLNDNIPRPTQDAARSIEEYLQVVPSKLEIMKQDFESKNSELGKKIEQLEEEKTNLRLDIDIQKSEAEKLRKGKRKAEEDLDSLKTDYKKLYLSMRTARLGKTSEQWRQEIQEEKAKVDQWKKRFHEAQAQKDTLRRTVGESQSENEMLRARVAELERALGRSRSSTVNLESSLNQIEGLKGKVAMLETVLQNSELRIQLLETNNERREEQLQHSQNQVRERDYLMGEAVIQIREVAEHLQTLAVQADVLSVVYRSESNRGRELASLLKKVKTLGIRARPYIYLGTPLLHTKENKNHGSKVGKVGADAERDVRPVADSDARTDKGKGPMVDVGDENENSTYPLVLAPVNSQAQPLRVSVNIRPQHQTGASAPANFLTGSSSNLGDNLPKIMVPDFDDAVEGEKAKAEFPKEFEDRCKWLEEKFKALESTDYQCEVDARKLSLVSNLVLPPKFKMPEFEKYNGTSCPEAHITMFCRRMTGYVNNDQLLIHCFQDSLTEAPAKWYNQLSCTQIKSWKDLAQAFMKHYGHVTDIAPDRIMLQNMEKKSGESFRKYAQRWREVAMQVQPPLLEKEMTMLFINTLKAPFINHMLGSATKSFTDIVMSGEMIENAIRCGKIKAGESMRKTASKKRENEELYKTLFDAHVVSPFYLKPLQPPYPKWYDTNARCEYHADVVGHSIENCTSFKRLVERLIKAGVVDFNDPPGGGNPLPSHTDNGVNAIENVNRSRDARNYCEFHDKEGHEIQQCNKFRTLVQGLMDNKELEFFDFSKEVDVCATEGGSAERVPKVNHPIVIITRPRVDEAGVKMAPRVEIKKPVTSPYKETPRVVIRKPVTSPYNDTPKIVIQKPVTFPYKDDKRVPWNYNCTVTVSEKVSSASTPNPEAESSMMKKGDEKIGPLVNKPVTENEAGEFLKFLKHSEYSVVEQLHKQPTRISVMALLLNSEGHRSALMKALNQIYVADDISVSKLDRLVGNISADNFISFSDDEIPPGGMGSTKALYITTRCKGYILPGVLIDNGSALNIFPLSTLNKLPVDSSHMKSCQNIVRAFDGTERKLMGRIEIPLTIGPNTYEVNFLVMDIKPSYNCLLGRPWIHSAGAVPSSLHQKLKLMTEGWLITISAEEDIIASVTSNAPYIENDTEAIKCSFRSLEFVNATFISEGSKISAPKISKATRMGLQLTVGKGALPRKGLGKYLQGPVRVLGLVDKHDRFGLGHRPDAR
ncbi:Gag-pro-like protein [Gossypium australe]|uniref:Gag-pro-like protein n=1 Tax=Gossypium australe TaxID=47621 RepID=A0A5B6WB97_9ROSI|nr:Gag-pro-like protein [Gossypium australe]